MSNDGYDLLGFFSLALLYFTMGLGCLFSTTIMDKIGVRTCMVIGSCCDFLWICSCIPAALSSEYPDSTSFFLSNGFIYASSSILSIVDGVGDAIQWVANGVYISDCATESKKGFYFSYFMAYYMASQVFGNLLAAFVLKYFTQS